MNHSECHVGEPWVFNIACSIKYVWIWEWHLIYATCIVLYIMLRKMCWMQIVLCCPHDDFLFAFCYTFTVVARKPRNIHGLQRIALCGDIFWQLEDFSRPMNGEELVLVHGPSESNLINFLVIIMWCKLLIKHSSMKLVVCLEYFIMDECSMESESTVVLSM